MDLSTLQEFLKWCVILNFGILCFWSVFLMFAQDFVYRMHSRWFSFSRPTFDAAIYAFLGFAKIVFVMFFLMPWLALVIIG